LIGARHEPRLRPDRVTFTVIVDAPGHEATRSKVQPMG
jgi:hypothetical protein